MSQVWIRWALYFAGAWNLIGGATALADPDRHFAQMYTGALVLEDPLQAFFFRGTWINVMAWGVGYLLAVHMPAGRVPILAAGGLGKLAYFVACVALFSNGRGSALLISTGVLDLAFAVFFAYVIWPRKAGNSGEP